VENNEVSSTAVFCIQVCIKPNQIYFSSIPLEVNIRENAYAILNANKIQMQAVNEGQKSSSFFVNLLPFDLENIMHEAEDFSF